MVKINREYLKEFCKQHNIFQNNEILQEERNKLKYNFGVPRKFLHSVKNFSDLEETINKYARVPIKADEDLNTEVILIYENLVPKISLIQNTKFDSQSDFVRRYFSSMFRF